MQYNKDNPLRVMTLCSGYDSQCLALEQLKKSYPNFDYDLFFRTYALMWYGFYPDVETVLAKYNRDNHPADYVRANFVMQMFDEFYDTYPQVKEGTAMYLPSEERLSVW